VSWLALLFVALGGFCGAGAFSMWRTDHRGAAVVLALIAAACLAAGILWMIPAGSQ